MPFTKGDPNINRSGRPVGITPKLKKCRELLSEKGFNPIEELLKLYSDETVSKKEKITILTELLTYCESKAIREIHSVSENTNLNKDLNGLTTEQLIKALNVIPDQSPKQPDQQ